MDDGGIVPALEEFPFEAPQEGYQSSLDLNQGSPHPPGWQDLHEGGWFYIKTRQGYGLLKLRQIRGNKTLRYQVLLNSKGGTNFGTCRVKICIAVAQRILFATQTPLNNANYQGRC